LFGAHQAGSGKRNPIEPTRCASWAQEDGLWAYIYDGISYDAGDKLGFLKGDGGNRFANSEFGGTSAIT